MLSLLNNEICASICNEKLYDKETKVKKFSLNILFVLQHLKYKLWQAVKDLFLCGLTVGRNWFLSENYFLKDIYILYGLSLENKLIWLSVFQNLWKKRKNFVFPSLSKDNQTIFSFRHFQGKKTGERTNCFYIAFANWSLELVLQNRCTMRNYRHSLSLLSQYQT